MLTNLFGRKRLFLGNWGDDLFEDLYAFIPQSTIADKINRQAVIPIYEDQDNFKCVDLLNQIHDSVLFQIPLSYAWIQHAEALLKLLSLITTPLQWHGGSFVLPANLDIGANLSNMIGVKYEQNAESLGARLKVLYEERIRSNEKVPLEYILQTELDEEDIGELLGVDRAS